MLLFVPVGSKWNRSGEFGRAGASRGKKKVMYLGIWGPAAARRPVSRARLHHNGNNANLAFRSEEQRLGSRSIPPLPRPVRASVTASLNRNSGRGEARSPRTAF